MIHPRKCSSREIPLGLKCIRNDKFFRGRSFESTHLLLCHSAATSERRNLVWFVFARPIRCTQENIVATICNENPEQ
jgi:hypothetical protein